MGFLKSMAINEARYPIRWGLDFSVAEASVVDTIGTAIKFRSGATLGYNATSGEWEKGVLFLATLSEGTYTSEYKGKYGRGFEIQIDTTSTRDGHPQGGLYVTFERASSYGHAGGSQDCALRVISENSAACPSGGVRGMDIMGYCKAAMGSCHGALITAKVKSAGSGTGTVYGARIVSKNQSFSGGWASQHALEVADESDGTNPAENSILFVEKASNSCVLDTKAGIEIVNNSHATYNYDITYGIYFKSGSSGCDITNAFGFDSNDGTDGFTAVDTKSHQGNVDGYIKVYDVATDQVLYVNCYDAVPA